MNTPQKPPTPVCSLNEEGANHDRLRPHAEGAAHVRLSCEATGLVLLKPIPRHHRQRALGFLLKGGFTALATGLLQQHSDVCQPSPHCLTPNSASTGALEGAAPHRCEPHPLQQPGAPARLCCLSRVQGAGSLLLPWVISDQWHLLCSPGALGCGGGSGRGHCTQSGSCKLKPALDKPKTKG